MKRMCHRLESVAFHAALFFALAATWAKLYAADTVDLSDAQAPNLGWTFDNGSEFPGATGGLSVGEEDGKPVLLLKGDFTGGGNYVQMAREIDLDIDTLGLSYKSDGPGTITFRIIDAGKQCHQIVYRIKGGTDWQRVQFPLRRFFDNLGKPTAVPGVVRYEHWGGANDGRWHGPAKLLVILAGRSGELTSRAVAVRDVQAIVGHSSAESAPQSKPSTLVQDWVPILDAEAQADWILGLGQEFKGAKGELKVVADQSEAGQTIMRLTADFSGGGAYVESRRALQWTGVEDMDRLRLRVRSSTTGRLTLRLGDGSDQTHQKKNAITFAADGQWHDVELAVSDIVGSESWGGAKDKLWHAPPKYIALIISKPATKEGEQPQPQIVEFSEISVRSVSAAVEQASAYTERFETSGPLPQGWDAQGDVAVGQGQAFEGEGSLQLSRTLPNVDQPTQATSPAFAVTPGNWLVLGAFRCDLSSPDASFNGVVAAELLDASGKVIDQTTLAEIWGQRNWQPIEKRIVAPPGATQARFVARLNKTHGQFSIDHLSARFLAPAPRHASRILRTLFATQRLGQLLYPGDSADVTLTIESGPKLPPEAQTVRYVVTDYWGAEQAAARAAQLTYSKRGQDGRHIYQTTLSMDGIAFETGRYYEVHISVDEPGGKLHEDFTSLAYLPEAATKQHPWQQIPFTSRNWDNRIAEYLHLSDRLGLRVVGIWSGWSAAPPYKLHAPQYELAMKLGMGTLMGTPGQTIEKHLKGWEKYDQTSLREGARLLVEAYGPEDKIMLCLGNEPPEIESRAVEAVAAYKAMYEGAKAANPNVVVVGTAVGANDIYFAAGMGQYLDVYDFHTYNDVTGIRKIFKQYDELFDRYGHRKPIWSTELGLNSQGIERRAVAGDLVRKFTTFFACGGENASWFGLLYPDPQGKETGSAGDSHNVFHCKYNCYSPRLDAIAYYNMVNGICIKKFVAEKAYGDVMATLFRDTEGRCLQVLWNDKASVDVFVPLDGVGAVQCIYIDGGIAPLNANGRGVTLRVGEDPVLLLYDQASGSLPDALGEPMVALVDAPEGMVKGEAVGFTLRLGDGVSPEQIGIDAPPFWTVANKQVQRDAQGHSVINFTLTAPQQTTARAGLIHVPVTDKDKCIGQLSFRQPVRGAMTARLLPMPIRDGKAGVRLEVTNNSADAQDVTWTVALGDAYRMTGGMIRFNQSTAPSAYFTAATEGAMTVLGQQTAAIDVPLDSVDPLTTYTLRATVSDAQGRALALERMMGGFIAAPRTVDPIQLDGKLDEPAWSKSQVIHIDQADQYFPLKHLNAEPWGGIDDASAQIRIVWDDQYLYLAADIRDDVLSQGQHGESMWMQDGIQLLIDPARGSTEKSGKYDYSMGVGTQGPQVWCHLSASPAVPNGEAADIRYVQSESGQGGNRTVEIAIPWSRLVPFTPAAGANLGMCIVVNEDDKPIRNCYMNWFGDIMTKSVQAVGDIILTE